MEKKYLKFDRETNPWGEFSNFWQHSSPLIYKGQPYATAEHLYQSMKYQYDNCSDASLQYADVIRTASTPFKAKLLAQQKCLNRYEWQVALGKLISEFRAKGAVHNPNWNVEKLDVMWEILQLKFEKDTHCRQKLLNTIGFQLVEHSKTDGYWGDGGDGSGENRLGRLLTKLRDNLVSERDASPKRK